MAARRIATLAALACLIVTASAQATPPPPPLVGNGDFENSTLPPWNVWRGSVRLADQTDWAAASGNKSVELSGYGALTQDIATTAWQRYDLSFAYAGNPSATCSGLKTLDVSWAGGLPTSLGKGGSFSFDTTGHTTASMGWQTAHLLVDATNSITTLAFGDDNAATGCGIVIDNVAMGTPSGTQTGTQLVGPESPPPLGAPVNVTATVIGSSAAVTPSGSVQFSVDGTPAGGPVTLANGQAQTALTGLARGTHNVDAAYTPDSLSFGASSVRGRVTVARAGTTTGLTVEPSSVATGEWTTLTAQVSVIAPGAGTPRGTVQFADEFGPIGDPVPIDGTGLAQVDVLEDLGDHYMYAYYSGDGDFVESNGYAPLTVFDPNPTPTGGDKIATTISMVASKSPSPPGEPYSVTATVTPATASDAVLDGTVSFTANSLAVGDPVPLDGNHTASVTITPPPGTARQTVRASYSGNASFLGSSALLIHGISLTPVRPPATAPGPTTPPPPDTQPPIFTVKLAPARLKQALRHGLRVHVDCNENCSADLRLALTARQAKAFGMRARGKSLVVAEGSYDFADRKASDIVIRFTPRARKALAKVKRVPLRLSVTAGDLSGNEAVKLQALTLKR